MPEFAPVDPTAGKTARRIIRGDAARPMDDPTAGMTARELRADPAFIPPITDPTDPRCAPVSRARDSHRPSAGAA